MCAAHSLPLLTIVFGLHIATSQKSKLFIMISVVVSSSYFFHCEILSLFIAAVDLLYNQRKDKILWKQKAHHATQTQAKQNKWNEENQSKKDENKLHTHRISMFSLCRRVCCAVLCCVLPFVYTQKRQTIK